MIMKLTSKIIIIIICIFSAGIFLSLALTHSPSSRLDEEKYGSSLSTDKMNTIEPVPVTIKNISTFVKTSKVGVIINGTVVEVPPSIPFYHATVRQGDILHKSPGDVMTPKENVTSEQEAPIIGAQAMEKYGGLPPDAVFAWSETNYAEIQTGTGLVISKKPVSTSVVFGRKVNGLSLEGDTDGIRLELGSNGELLELRKLWRTLTFSGNVSVIPAMKAIEELELPNYPVVTIDTVSLRYFETGDGDTYLEPVWVLKGKSQPSRHSVEYILNARKFAEFSAMPTIVRNAEPVTFTDMSQTAAVKWFWDFGDGTNATIRNITHSYLRAGNYSVNLTVWNEHGSDTILKVDSIMVLANQTSVIEKRYCNTTDIWNTGLKKNDRV